MKKILAYLLTMVMMLSVCTPMLVVQAAAVTVDPYLDEALVEFAQTPQITVDLADGASIVNGSVANLTDGIVGDDDTADQAGALGIGIDSGSELTWADGPAEIIVDLGEGGQEFSGVRLYASIWRPWRGQTEDIYGYRALTRGFISVSENGEEWYDLDRQEFNRLERYIDFKIEKCGREVNANVRYVRVIATATTSAWWIEELALLAPDENLPTVSSDFEASFQAIVKDELKAFFIAMLGEEAAATHLEWVDAHESDIADKNGIVDYIEQVIAENAITKIDMEYGDPYEYREILAQVVTGITDTSVVEEAGDDLKTTGLGYALLSDGENIEVLKVVPSPVALVVLTGQSNSAGAESDWTKSPAAVGEYEDKIFITNTLDGNMDTTFNGEVTFTDAVYAAEHGGRTSYFPCSPDQGGPHPSSIRSAGLASALAMQLYDEWQTPVWVLNAGVSGCIIERFDPAFEGNDDFATHDAYDKVVGYSDKVKELISANEHYYLDDSKTTMFWLQGCSNGIGAPNVLTIDEYREKFTNMYEGFKEDIGVNSANIILVRGQLANNGVQDFYMSGPRMAQIYMGNNNEDYADVNLIMNTDVLKNDAAVRAYFAAKYPDADAFEARWGYARPTTHNGIKPTIHYSQEGYNEIGDESGINFRKIASGETDVTEAVLLGYNGLEPEKFTINMENGETEAVAVPMPTNINFNASANLTVVIEDEDVATYNAETLAIEAVGNGETTATLMAGETVLAEYPVEVIKVPTLIISGSTDATTSLTLINKAGKAVTGVAYGDMEITFDEANTNEEEIVITRANIKTIYPLLAPDTEQIELTVTYDDEETEDYPVNVVAQWVGLTGQAATGTFASDEIVVNATNYPDFRVRTDSYVVAGTYAFHAIQSFIKTHATLPATNALYRSITSDGQSHYIDVDFGETVTTSGLRYEINNFYHYFSNVKVYGSDDGEDWTLIKSADETTQRTSDYLYAVDFGKMVSYRYYRIATTSRAGSVLTNINEIRFVKPTFVFSSKSGAQPSNNLTLPNGKGLEVKSVTGNGVALTVDSTSTTENTVILRANLMLALGATDGDIELVVTYSDDSTETYIVSTTAAWVKASEVAANGNTPTYASDEVVVTDYTDFAVRASSYMTNGQMKVHPIQSFTRSNTVTTGLSQSATNTYYHTIDVDFGRSVKTLGFRFEATDLNQYNKLTEVYGSNDCENWEKLASATASAAYSAAEQTLLFDKAVDYRYYRIYINSLQHFIKYNEMRFVKSPFDTITSKAWVKASEKTVPANMTPSFDADEVVVTNYANFAVRSSTQMSDALHPVWSFIETNATVSGGLSQSATNTYHHVIDVDFGEAIKTSGFRFETYNWAFYNKLTEVYGSADGSSWTLVGSKVATGNYSAYEQQVAFDETANYRYYRIYMVSFNHFIKLSEMRFVKGIDDSFIFSNIAGNTTSSITLLNKAGLAVSSVKAGNESVAFTANGTKSFTLARADMDPVYKAMGADGGAVELTVTYSNGTTDTYTVKAVAEWATLSNENASQGNDGTFEADEINPANYANFRVRTDSYTSGNSLKNHPIQSFLRTNPDALGGATHIWQSMLSDSETHYIDVDFGEAVKTGGFRFELYNRTAWLPSIAVYGSEDCESWTLLGTKTASGTAGSMDIQVAFEDVAEYRYYRIATTAQVHFTRINEMRFVAPKSFVFSNKAGATSTSVNFFRKVQPTTSTYAGVIVDSVLIDGNSVEFTTPAPTTITVTRDAIRAILPKLGVEERVPVTINYTLWGTAYSYKEYLDIVMEWATLADENTSQGNDGIFAADEINPANYANFRVRTDSYTSGSNLLNHPIQSFLRTNPNINAGNTWIWQSKLEDGTVHYIDVDFGKAVTTSAFRYELYNRGHYMPSVSVYGSNDGKSWTLLATEEDSATQDTFEQNLSFGNNVEYRYFRIYTTAQVHFTRFNEMRFVGERTFVDSTTEFALAVKGDGVVTSDTKLVFANTNRVAVDTVKVGDAVIPHDTTETNEYQTVIVRNNNANNNFEDLSNLYDMYAGINLAGEKVVTFTVNYIDGTSENFPVTFKADWYGTADAAAVGSAATFGDDEIDVIALEGFKVRTDSVGDNSTAPADGLLAYHPITAFVRENGNASVLYRSRFEEKSKGNYIDVDFGQKVEIGGFRYVLSDAIASGTEKFSDEYFWTNVEILGSNDYAEWTPIHTAEFAETGSRDIIFEEAANYQYIRIHATPNKRYMVLSEMRFLKPVEEEKVTVKVETVGGTVEGASGTVTGDQVFGKNEEITLTAKPEEGATFKYWIEANTGKIITTDEKLTMSGSVGRQVLAVFEGAEERFISFYGKDKKTIIGHDTSTPFGEEPDAEVIPSELKAYVSGHRLLGWKLNDAGEILVAGSLGTTGEDYYAVYEQISIGTYTLTLGEGASLVSQSIDASAIPYGQTVQVKAADTTEAGTFMYWKQNDEIVSYDKIYTFRMPANNITLTPVYGNDAVTEEVAITMVVNGEEAVNADGTKMAGFMITRTVPEGTEVTDTGIIYVRDSAYGDLTTASVGKTSSNGKIVNVSLSTNKGTGQYKFNARYEVTTGIKAIAFITYKVGDELITVYSEPQSVAKTN